MFSSIVFENCMHNSAIPCEPVSSSGNKIFSEKLGTAVHTNT